MVTVQTANADRKVPHFPKIEGNIHKLVFRWLWHVDIQIVFPNSFTEKALRKKWKNIRDQFMKEFKKIPVSRSGDAGADQNTSMWPYFKMMLFIKDDVTPEINEGNLDETTDENSNNNDDDERSSTPQSIAGASSRACSDHEVKVFSGKLPLWKRRWEADNFANFSMFEESLTQGDGTMKSNSKLVQTQVSDHLEALQKSFQDYFSPEQLDKETWACSPFLIDMDNISDEDFIKDDLIDMRSKEVLRAEFHAKTLGEFWCSLSHAYPTLVKRAMSVLIPLAGSTPDDPKRSDRALHGA
ncbi:unnamed protein product [Leptosia nina]|uniref:MADF domain-containing protein n=1 Tax=Leptosia nina TaxID=320188 RepID=A0AAV1JWM7_9NEOP